MGSFEKDANKHVRKGKKEAAQLRCQVASLQAEQASTDSQSQARGGLSSLQQDQCVSSVQWSVHGWKIGT